MSILHYNLNSGDFDDSEDYQLRCKRDALADIKYGLDLIFTLKNTLDGLHPVARSVLIEMFSK